MMLKTLDPHKNLITCVLDERHCIAREDRCCFKDLRQLQNRSPERLIFVDSSIVAFSPQLENGIYVPSYHGQEDDTALLVVLEFLLTLKHTTDVRPLVVKFAGLLRLRSLRTSLSDESLLEEDHKEGGCWTEEESEIPAELDP